LTFWVLNPIKNIGPKTFDVSLKNTIYVKKVEFLTFENLKRQNIFDVLGVLKRQKRFRRVVFDVSKALKNSLSKKLSF
jgi:hypothetical protein